MHGYKAAVEIEANKTSQSSTLHTAEIPVDSFLSAHVVVAAFSTCSRSTS